MEDDRDNRSRTMWPSRHQRIPDYIEHALQEIEKDRALFIQRIPVQKHHRYIERLKYLDKKISNAGKRRDHYAALKYLPRRLKLHKEMGFRAGVAEDHYSLGEVYADVENIEKAGKEFSDALTTFKDLGLYTWVYSCLTWLSDLDQQRGRYLIAESHLLQAQDLADAIGKEGLKADALNRFGGLYLHVRNYPHARSCLKDALTIYRDAETKLKDGLTIYRDADIKPLIARTLHNIGLTHLSPHGDTNKALRLFQEAQTIYEDRGDEIGIAECLTAIGIIYEGIDNSKALDSLRQAETIWHRWKSEIRAALCSSNIGNIYCNQGNYPEARKRYEGVLAAMHKRQNPEGIYLGLYNIGQLLARENKLEEAYPYLAIAINIIESWRHFIPKEREQQISFIEKTLNCYLLLMEKVLWPLERYNEALNIAERARGRTLADLLAWSDLAPSKNTPPQILKSLSKLHKQERELLWFPKFTLDMKQSALDLLSKRQSLQIERASLLDQIRNYDPSFTGKVDNFPATTDEILSSIRDTDVAVVTFFLSAEKTYAFVASAGGRLNATEIETFRPAEIEVLARRWVREYSEFREQKNEAGWRACIDDTLRSLHDKLFVPLKPLLPERVCHLIFVPHRFLHLFPLHAMFRLDNGRRIYLLDEFDKVSYAPSMAILVRCRMRNRSRPQKLYALKNPTGELTFAEQEVTAVASLFMLPPTIRPQNGDMVTAEGFFQETSSADLVLCTGHSESGDPHNAYLQISLTRKLNLRELIVGLDLPQCTLWDFSTCEAGIPQSDWADEWITLASAPLIAGAATVWSSLWMVDDFATAELKKRAYENFMLHGMDKVLALNEAQRSFIRGEFDKSGLSSPSEEHHRLTIIEGPHRVKSESFRLTEQHCHPFYWAPFIASGAP